MADARPCAMAAECAHARLHRRSDDSAHGALLCQNLTALLRFDGQALDTGVADPVLKTLLRPISPACFQHEQVIKDTQRVIKDA